VVFYGAKLDAAGVSLSEVHLFVSGSYVVSIDRGRRSDELNEVRAFFGQNFAWLVRHIDTFDAFLAFGIGGLLLPVVILLGWFRRAGYF